VPPPPRPEAPLPPPLSPAAWDRKRKSPGLAALLSLLPGLGQFYNGQSVKGIVFLAVFFGLVQLTEHDDFVALFVVGFYLYAVYDAYRTARQINAAVVEASRAQTAPAAAAPGPTQEPATPRPADLSLSFNTREGSRVWGYMLVALGVLLLLANLGIPVLHLIRVLWPVGLIVLGARMLKRYMRSEGG
jgi:TM2 domain-containing membrane protein YozV